MVDRVLVDSAHGVVHIPPAVFPVIPKIKESIVLRFLEYEVCDGIEAKISALVSGFVSGVKQVIQPPRHAPFRPLRQSPARARRCLPEPPGGGRAVRRAARP